MLFILQVSILSEQTMTNLLRDVIRDRRRPVRTTQSLEHTAGASSYTRLGVKDVREGREPHQTQHQVHPETPPASPAPLKGGKKKKKSQGAKLPKKFPRGGKSAEQGAQSLKGDVYVLCKNFSWQKAPTAQQTKQHKSHMSCPWCKLYPYT